MNFKKEDLKNCYNNIRTGSHSFYSASRLLPKSIRDPAIVLYSFCRLADDVVDQGEKKDNSINVLKDRLEMAYLKKPFDSSTDRAFSKLVHDYKMPIELPMALLQGLEWDFEGKRFRTLSDLHSYSARVASSVGVMMCVLMNVRNKDVLARACDLGAAMQLTNIARDIGEDARNGRIYIPLDWMDEEKIDIQKFILNPTSSPEVSRLAKRLLNEAEKLYLRAQTGLSCLPIGCRPGIFAARHIYERIGKHIASYNYNSITKRAYTTKLEKLSFLALSLANTATTAVMPKSAVIHAAPLKEMNFLINVAFKENETFLSKKTNKLLNILEDLERKDRIVKNFS